MRTVLVTGGAGFVGSHLVDQLLEGGAAVRVLDNLSTGSLANLQTAADRHARGGRVSNGSRLEVIIGDVRDREALRKALRDVKYVFHLAALPASAVSIVDPSDVHSVNVEGTLNVLHGALTEGVWRVVVGSCSSVYGKPEGETVSEDAPLMPASLFGASKAAAETYCRAFHARHQLDTVVLRYFRIYGPRQGMAGGEAVVPNLIQAARDGRPMWDQADASGGDFLYVEDAVAATLASANAPRATGLAINVGSGQIATVRDVRSILGRLLHTAVISRTECAIEAPGYQLCADTTRARELLGFTPRVSLVSGLAQLVRTMNEREGAAQSTLASVAFDD